MANMPLIIAIVGIVCFALGALGGPAAVASSPCYGLAQATHIAEATTATCTGQPRLADDPALAKGAEAILDMHDLWYPNTTALDNGDYDSITEMDEAQVEAQKQKWADSGVCVEDLLVMDTSVGTPETTDVGLSEQSAVMEWEFDCKQCNKCKNNCWGWVPCVPCFFICKAVCKGNKYCVQCKKHPWPPVIPALDPSYEMQG